MRRPLTAVLIAVGVCGLLAGCGKAGRPLAPADSTFPQTYPARDLVPKSALPPEWDQDDMKQAYPNGAPEHGGPVAAKSHYIDSSTTTQQPNDLRNTQLVGPKGVTTSGAGTNSSTAGSTDSPLSPVSPNFPGNAQ